MDSIVSIVCFIVIVVAISSAKARRNARHSDAPTVKGMAEDPMRETIRTDALNRDQRRAKLAESRDRMLTERSIRDEKRREELDQEERNAQARRASEAAMREVAEEQKARAEEFKRKEGERNRNKEKAKRRSEANAHEEQRQQVYRDRVENEEKLTAGARAREAADPDYGAREEGHAEEAAASMDIVYDLIACGYDPKKMGQRDFLAEGQKMLDDYAWQ